MEDRGLGDLSNRNRFSYTLGDWKSEIKVSTSVFLLRPHSSACRRHPLPVSSHGLPSVHVCVLISSSYKDINHIGLRSTLDPILPYYLFKGDFFGGSAIKNPLAYAGDTGLIPGCICVFVCSLKLVEYKVHKSSLIFLLQCCILAHMGIKMCQSMC